MASSVLAGPGAVFDGRYELMKRQLLRLMNEEAGQDLVEYALLASAIGLATVAAIAVLSSSMNSTYASWDASTQDLWEVPPPK